MSGTDRQASFGALAVAIRSGTLCAGAALAAALWAGAVLPALAGADSFTFHAPLADEDLEGALRAASLLVALQEGEEEPDTAEWVASAQADYARLLGALYAQGYYGGTISIRLDGIEAAAVPPLPPPGRVDRVDVFVDRGPVYRFSEATIGPVARQTELPAAFARGEVARSGILQDAVDAAVVGWREAGHAKADLAGQEVTARHDEDAIAAVIRIAPGPRLRFGRLVIEGESAVSNRRIRKIANLPEGRTFDPDALDRAGSRLRETGVFRSVALVEADIPNADGTLDITAQIVDMAPRRFGFGAEVQTQEGATLSAFWMHRNLLGGAERLRVEGEVSNLGGGEDTADYELGFTLTRPATLDAETDAILQGRVASLTEDDYEEDTATLGLGFERRATDRVTARASIEYRFSDVTDAFGTREYQQVFFPLGATLDTREDPLNPVQGFYVDLEAAPFYGLDGSDSGARFEFDTRAYRGFGAGNRTVVAARLQGGVIRADRLQSLPAELRFYSGGGGSVRGQDYQNLGVFLDDDRLVGGRNWLGVQSELRQGVTDSIALVAFYDWGFVGAGTMFMEEGESHAGAGLGLRYKTPIGPIRVDLGVPVSGPDSASSFQIYIGIGQAF